MHSGHYFERHSFACDVIHQKTNGHESFTCDFVYDTQTNDKPWAIVIPIEKCLGVDHLYNKLQKVTERKGMNGG